MTELFKKVFSKVKMLFSKNPQMSQNGSTIGTNTSTTTTITGDNNSNVGNITNHVVSTEKSDSEKKIVLRENVKKLYIQGVQAHDSVLLNNSELIMVQMNELKLEIEKALANDFDDKILTAGEKELINKVVNDIFNMHFKSRIYAIAKMNEKVTDKHINDKDGAISAVDGSYEELQKSSLFK